MFSIELEPAILGLFMPMVQWRWNWDMLLVYVWIRWLCNQFQDLMSKDWKSLRFAFDKCMKLGEIVVWSLLWNWMVYNVESMMNEQLECLNWPLDVKKMKCML